MRIWIALVLVACTEPPKRPVIVPGEPGGIQGCRSRATELGGVHYDCTGFEITDSVGPPLSIATIRDQLKAAAGKIDAQVTAGPHAITGVDDAILVEYSKRGKHAFDVVAVAPVEAKTRAVQCHVDWFDDGQAGRVVNCDRAVALVLERPAPPGRELSAQCGRAIAYLAELPPHSAADDTAQRRTAQRSTAARCNDTLAACILASTTYVEATLCTDR